MQRIHEQFTLLLWLLYAKFGRAVVTCGRFAWRSASPLDGVPKYVVSAL